MGGYIGSKASVVSSGAERKKTYAITTTTTSLTGLAYTPTKVHVYHNGIRLVDGTDYTATDGSSITLTTAAENGDEVVVISYATFQTSDTVSASAGGTFAGNVAMSGTLDVTGATTLSSDLNVGTIKDTTGTNTALTIDSDGVVLTPNRPAFSVTDIRSIGGLTGDIVFNTVDFDIGGNYNTSTGLFTAPVSGIYCFSFTGFSANSSGNMTTSNQSVTVSLYKNSSTHAISAYNQVLANGYNNMSLSNMLQLSASDTININVSSGNIYTDTSGRYLKFSGHLIG